MESQIAGLLKLSQEQLARSEFISQYPKSVEMNNYDPISKIDSFYKNICNVCFYDSLLIAASLLSKDDRVISFWNWERFIDQKQKGLEKIEKLFESYKLKQVRNEIVAHADFNNRTNSFPYLNRKGIINEKFIKCLKKIQLKLIDEFLDYTKKYSTPYSNDNFSTKETIRIIKDVMRKASPKMTKNVVIR